MNGRIKGMKKKQQSITFYFLGTADLIYGIGRDLGQRKDRA